MNLVKRSALRRQISDRRRVAGQRSPLLEKDWAFVDALVLDDFTAADWELLDRQRVHDLPVERAK